MSIIGMAGNFHKDRSTSLWRSSPEIVHSLSPGISEHVAVPCGYAATFPYHNRNWFYSLAVMPKVWIGNLVKDVTVDHIQKVLDDHGLIPSDIQLKRGYAFVEFPTQETADSAISQLNG
jgi:hypothetical protein